MEIELKIFFWGIPLTYILLCVFTAYCTRWKATKLKQPHYWTKQKYPWEHNIYCKFAIYNPHNFGEVGSWLLAFVFLALMWPILPMVGAVLGFVKLLQNLLNWFINIETKGDSK